MESEHSKAGKREALRRFGLLGIGLVLLAGLWILFVASVHPQEMILGSLCVAATAVFVAFVWASAESEHFEFAASDLMQVWRAPGQILSDALRVTVLLLRKLSGGKPPDSVLQVYRFETLPGSPRAHGRRVLAVAYLTASPNSIVLGIHPRRELIMMHQLIPSPPSKMARELGARPLS